MRKNKFMTIITLTLLLAMLLFGCNNDTPKPDDGNNQQGGGTETPVDPDKPEVKPEEPEVLPEPERGANEKENQLLYDALVNLGSQFETETYSMGNLVNVFDFEFTNSDIFNYYGSAQSEEFNIYFPGLIVSSGSLYRRAVSDGFSSDNFLSDEITASFTITGDEKYAGVYKVVTTDAEKKQYVMTRNGENIDLVSNNDFRSLWGGILNSPFYAGRAKGFDVKISYEIPLTYTGNPKGSVTAVMVASRAGSGTDTVETVYEINTNADLTYNENAIKVKTKTDISTKVTTFEFIQIGETVLEPSTISENSCNLVSGLVMALFPFQTEEQPQQQ